MKKFLVIFAFILLLTGCKNNNIENPREPIEQDPIVTPTPEDPDEEIIVPPPSKEEEKEYKKYEIIQLEENIVCKNDLIRTDLGYRYYPFIHSLEENRKLWIETKIGETNCQEGYFYCKDMYTGEIRQLASKEISRFDSDFDIDDGDHQMFYYILENKICRINPLGTELEIMYTGKQVNEAVFENYKDLIIFIDDDAVKTLNKYTGEIIEYFTQSGIDEVRYSHYYDYITYHIGSNVYSFNRTTKEIKQITESQESGYYSKSSSPIEE